MATRFVNHKPLFKIFKQGIRRKTLATSVHKVGNDVKALSQLMDKLKVGLPASNLVYVCTRNARDNKILSNFYTNGWPDFSSVICQIQKPRLSDESDLLCYSTCEASILSLLQESGVITWGRWQLIEGLESDHADHLIEMLRGVNSTATGQVEGRYEGSLLYYPYKHIPPRLWRNTSTTWFETSLQQYLIVMMTNWLNQLGRCTCWLTVEVDCIMLMRSFEAKESLMSFGLSLWNWASQTNNQNGDIAIGNFDKEHVGLGTVDRWYWIAYC